MHTPNRSPSKVIQSQTIHRQQRNDGTMASIVQTRTGLLSNIPRATAAATAAHQDLTGTDHLSGITTQIKQG
jgi:hypothetical protein